LKPILEIQNISKKFRIQHENQPYLSLRDSLTSVFKKKTTTSEEFYALKDVSFTVNPGESIGIIGRNGAGKSTLLKILSSITPPSSGKIITRGRIASLLEVGTGFHPELTGRENVFLNGSILGMRRHEILKNFDAIVDFAGVEKFIDTPLKHYSSGMQLRLAFAVAAFLENEILVIDEVLAVGDAEFQKKCMGKMGDISKEEGRTILFVSHNMGAIKELCTRVIMLNKGELKQEGEKNEIIRSYLLNPVVISSASDFLNDLKSRRGNGEVRFTKIVINNGEMFLDPEKEISIRMEAVINESIDELYFYFLIKSPETSEPISNTQLTRINSEKLIKGENVKFSMFIKPNTFRTGLFPTYFWLGKKSELDAAENYHYDTVDAIYYFNLSSNNTTKQLGYNSLQPLGYFNMNYEIELNS
jgi:ABC-type polysaccharide/polyol phosphate transport system ATPase subunit